MRRLLISGLAFLLGAALLVRIACSRPAEAGKPAPAGRTDPLVFVFLRVDSKQEVAILRPMIAPDIGVQLDSGPRTLQPNTVLHCQTSTRAHRAIVEGQTATVSELLLDCGDHKFVVKGLDFTQRAK